jgi:hypothetical protein
MSAPIMGQNGIAGGSGAGSAFFDTIGFVEPMVGAIFTWTERAGASSADAPVITGASVFTDPGGVTTTEGGKTYQMKKFYCDALVADDAIEVAFAANADHWEAIFLIVSDVDESPVLSNDLTDDANSTTGTGGALSVVPPTGSAGTFAFVLGAFASIKGVAGDILMSATDPVFDFQGYASAPHFSLTETTMAWFMLSVDIGDTFPFGIDINVDDDGGAPTELWAITGWWVQDVFIPPITEPSGIDFPRRRRKVDFKELPFTISTAMLEGGISGTRKG